MDRKDIESLLDVDYSKMTVVSIASHASSCGMILAIANTIKTLERLGYHNIAKVFRDELSDIEKAHEKEYGQFVNFSDKY